MELQSYAAGASDALQHRERVPGVFSILETRNHRLRSTNFLGKLGLSQPRFLSHFAHQKSQINLVQGAREDLAVGCALSRPLPDNLAVSVALDGVSHRPNSFRMASLSFCDPV